MTAVEARPDRMNEQTGPGIEWAKWSWNPVTGCRYGCRYCYAEDQGRRFPEIVGGDFNPRLHADRLAVRKWKPRRTLTGPGERLVFTVSMGELFGPWISREWIDRVFEVVEKCPEWTFLFLTKNPERFPEITFPINAWVGATVDSQDRVRRTEEALTATKATVRFISFEPLQGPMRFSGSIPAEWVVLGGRTGHGGMAKLIPPREWVEDLTRQARESGAAVYYKPNLRAEEWTSSVPKEYPMNVKLVKL